MGRAAGRRVHVGGDLLRRRRLHIDGGGDRRGDLGDAGDGGADFLMMVTESFVAACTPPICTPISSVAFEVCAASALTSCATMAKPRPDSPARAASIVALSARRLVCSAMSVISFTTSPMRPAARVSSAIRASVFSACATASSAMRDDSCTCRLISPTELISCSVADETVCTFSEACVEAAKTFPDRSRVAPAVVLKASAAASSSVDDADTDRTTFATVVSKAPARAFMSAWRCSALRRAVSFSAASN